MQNSQTDVIFSQLRAKCGTIGIITLNRPQVLNALSQNMVLAINAQLQQWASDDNICIVVIQANNPRAFCAGGDLKFLYQNKNVSMEESITFFRTEYNLNLLINQYPKPYLALLDGITMGGGLGLSVHGQRCIATEYLQMAMPETAIGLYPDVGSAYFLAKSPHQLGMYLALTGNSIGVADAILCDLIDAYIPRANLSKVILTLTEYDLTMEPLKVIDTVINQYQTTPGNAPLLEYLNIIEESFAQNTVSEIIQKLYSYDIIWAQQQAQILEDRSPTSLMVTHKNLQLAATRSLRECLTQDLNLTMHFTKLPDLYEGIRAKLIEKTNNPHWQPNNLAAVTDKFINNIFEIQWQL